MVIDPKEYRWSSYRTNGEGAHDPILTPHSNYLRLGQNESERQATYRALFEAHIEPEKLNAIRHATNGNYALGNSRFQEEIAQMLKRRVTPGKNGRPAKNTALKKF